MAQTLPKLTVDSLTAEKIGEGVYKVVSKVSNAGYLPTFVCNEAKRLKVDQPLKVEVKVDGEIVVGKAEDTLGHLEGFSGVNSKYHWDGIATFKHAPFTVANEWIVKAEEGKEFTLTLTGAKAGTTTATVVLK